MRPSKHILAALLAIAALAACGDTTVPTSTPDVAGAATSGAVGAAQADRLTASALWQARTREVVGRRRMSSNAAARLFALVSVAQYDAVIAAERARERGSHPSEAGAASAAAATVIAGIQSAEQGFVEDRLSDDAAYFRTLPSERDADFAAGVEVGRAVGEAVLAYGSTDGSATPWDGAMLAGPGRWKPRSLPPQDAMWGGVRPWLMSSGDQFAPPSPPEVGTPEYLADLAEVRSLSDGRTLEQLRIAQYWATGYGAGGPAGFFGSVASALATEQQMDERRTARVLAVMHMAVMDASIGCYESKYRHWYFRPYEADPAITVPVSIPNFPSYPSAHSCLSSAAAEVLAAHFPAAAAELRAMVEEAGVSRIYAGLHFRFDVTAGQRLGASVAELALRLAPRGHEPIPLD